MELIAPAHVDSPFKFSFRPPEKSPSPLLRLENGATGYGDTTILQGVNLTLVPGDRIGLLGHNGAGKSTLIKLLAESLPLTNGERQNAQHLAIGYFAQHQMDQLHPEHTPLEHLLQLDPKASEQACRDYLGGFGFSGKLADRPTAPFSGGEKARLVLALLIYQRPNLLLLDEPTNHLDLEMRHSLSQALQGFSGAMVVVSHDRHLLRTCIDQLFLVNAGRVEEFKGDLDDYPRWLAESRREEEADSTPTESPEHSAAARKERKRREAEQRQQLKPLRQKGQQLEKELSELTKHQAELEQQLAGPEIYSDEKKTALQQLLKEKRHIDSRLVAVEEEWLQTVEEIEALQSSSS
jgi:ATP-binding cassette subfamily F protein 3